MKTHVLSSNNIDDLLLWYDQNKRALPWRIDTDPYRVWVSEIMAQQTRISAVIPYYNRFMHQVPDIKTLADLPSDTLMKLWEGLGYYSRARNLQKAAQKICVMHGGKFPNNYSDILALPGIGQYTAAAIASISFSLPYPVVDGNVLRVMCRIENNFSDIAKPDTKQYYFDRLKTLIPQSRPGDFNQAVMELGALICMPNGIPKCDLCPVNNACMAFQNGNWDILPVKSAKSPRREEKYTVLLVIKNNHILLQKRKESGLLANMYQYCMLNDHLSEKQVISYLCDHRLKITDIRSLPDTTHVFTHKEWNMNCYIIIADDQAPPLPGYEYVALSDVFERYPIPSAFKTYTDVLKEYKHER